MAESRIVQDLRKELKEVEGALSDLRLTGQDYSLAGSHSRSGVDYATLLRHKRTLEQRIASLNGATTYTTPDYS